MRCWRCRALAAEPQGPEPRRGGMAHSYTVRFIGLAQDGGARRVLLPGGRGWHCQYVRMAHRTGAAHARMSCVVEPIEGFTTRAVHVYVSP